jgi:hypothetical protein
MTQGRNVPSEAPRVGLSRRVTLLLAVGLATVAIAAMVGGVLLFPRGAAERERGTGGEATPAEEATPSGEAATEKAVRPVEQARDPVEGLWLSRDELADLPMRGPAWEALLDDADSKLGTARIAKQNSKHDVRTLAAALVFARTGDEAYREKSVEGIAEAIGTEEGGRTLALGRNLPGYVIAADLLGLAEHNPELDREFRDWLTDVRTAELDGRTLVSTHEDRPNNWGTHAGAARVAASAYLDDDEDVASAASVFKGVDFTIVGSTSEFYAKDIKSDYDRFSEAVRISGAKSAR